MPFLSLSSAVRIKWKKVNEVLNEYMAHRKRLGNNIYSDAMIIILNVTHYYFCCFIVVVKLTNA